MEAQLTFDLDDPDDVVRHLQCVKAKDMLRAINKFFYRVRSVQRDGKDPGAVLGQLNVVVADDDKNQVTEYWGRVLQDELQNHDVYLEEILP